MAGGTPWSVAILASFWVWPLLESSYGLTTGLFVGTAVMMDRLIRYGHIDQDGTLVGSTSTDP